MFPKDTMALTPDEIAELQERAAEVDDLRLQLAALSSNKNSILDEKKTLQAKLKELSDKEEERQKKELEEQGRTMELLEQERREKAELVRQMNELEQGIADLEKKRVSDRLEADFVAAMSGEVFAPRQLWALFAGSTQDKDGKTVVNYNGASVSLPELSARLRADANYAHHFKPKQSSGGMGLRASSGGHVAESSNPYLPGGSITARIRLEVEDPDLAAKLKAEATSARAG